jgi:hypothetical protein
VGARTAYIEKASPRENGYVESFNGKLRDELLNGEVFNTLRPARGAGEDAGIGCGIQGGWGAQASHPPTQSGIPMQASHGYHYRAPG